MRYAIISDVHGNLHALRAVVSAARRHGVDGWLCAGDLIGWGAHPNECVDLLRELGAVTVAGNHDLIAVGFLDGSRSSPAAAVTHEWTASRLRPDVLEHLGSLPLVLQHDGVVVAHGSLDDPERYVDSAARYGEERAQVAAWHPTSRALVLGHTHRARLYLGESGHLRDLSRVRSSVPLSGAVRPVLNPGSVGQSREWEWPPVARAVVLDTRAQTLLPLLVTYEWRHAWRELRRHDLGYRSLHSPPQARELLPPVARRSLRRLRRLSREAALRLG